MRLDCVFEEESAPGTRLIVCCPKVSPSVASCQWIELTRHDKRYHRPTLIGGPCRQMAAASCMKRTTRCGSRRGHCDSMKRNIETLGKPMNNLSHELTNLKWHHYDKRPFRAADRRVSQKLSRLSKLIGRIVSDGGPVSRCRRGSARGSSGPPNTCLSTRPKVKSSAGGMISSRGSIRSEMWDNHLPLSGIRDKQRRYSRA
jgi:hypothetical protein